MTPEFQQRVSEALQEYLKLPEASRKEFLERLRSSDAELAAELESRLRSHAAKDTPGKEEGDTPQQPTATTVDYVRPPQSPVGEGMSRATGWNQAAILGVMATTKLVSCR